MRRLLFAGCMSAALLGGSYTIVNAETTTLLAAMSVQPDQRRTRIIDTFIGALIAAGVWSKIDVMWVLAAHDEQAGRLNWKSPGNFTLTAVNSPTFTPDRGFAGNGSTSYLDTGWDAATNGVQYTRNDAHIALYSRTGPGSNVPSFGAAASYNISIVSRTGTSDRGRANASSDLAGVAGGTQPQQVMMRRNVSTDADILRDGVEMATAARTSVALSSSDIAFGLNINYSNGQSAIGSLGAYLDDTEALAYYNACNAYLVAIGADT